MSVPFAVFASGSGTNLQSLLDRSAEGAAYKISLVVTDRPCAAEERAQASGLPAVRLPFGEGGTKVRPEAELLRLLRGHEIQGILLAGFLRLVPAGVCREYEGTMLNIHPAPLPSFGGRGMYGRRVHEAVLRSGAKLSGPTVHYVNERYDRGRILAQWPVPVLPGDTPSTLAARVLAAEHVLYPEAAHALAAAIKRGQGEPFFCWRPEAAILTSASAAVAFAPRGTAPASPLGGVSVE